MKNIMDMSDEERRQWAETEQDRQTFGYDVGSAPTENTGDEGLREKVAEIIYGVGDVPQNAFLADVEAIMALIRQDRRELLERLIDKRQNCYDCIHEDENMNSVPFISETTILDELQHRAESAAIDYGGGNRG